ncbi:MAG: glycogen synthase [Alphaproteobacteria bacterium]
MSGPRRKVLFVASECLPYAKAGGLGDVVSALSKELVRRGDDARILLPLYGSIDRRRHGIEPLQPICVHMGGEEIWAGISRGMLDGLVPVYFLEHGGFFGGRDVYGVGAAYEFDARRFAFLSRASLQLALDLCFTPDVMHLHDWQTSLVAAYLSDLPPGFEPLAETATVLTIHNVEYQGKFPADSLDWMALRPDVFRPDRIEDFGGLNLLKCGIAYADALTTVSPTHAREMTGEPGGHGLGEMLAARASSTAGILNGVDDDVWNPEIDPMLPARFGADEMRGKFECRRALQHRFGLDDRPDLPILGIVSRFAPQKGFDLLREVLPSLLDEGLVQLCVIGSGARHTEDFFRALATVHPGRAGAYFGYTEEGAHLVEAGSDFFLMPSIYEPCGLNQMYSMRYGTLPVVRATGGLADTVSDHDPRTGAGTGFVFVDATAEAAGGAIRRAVRTWWEKPSHVGRMRRAGMALRFPWSVGADLYERTYERAIAARRERAEAVQPGDA